MRDVLDALARLAPDGWLVGGAVRDRLLERSTDDFDVAVPGEPGAVARALAVELPAHVFRLSEGFGAWRVVDRGRRWQVDVLPVAQGGIEADLARRDLTVNAIAEPLAGGKPIDPFGGREDLSRRQLRMVSEQAFRDDPLRALRVVRLSCELGFSVEAGTAAVVRRCAGGLAAVSPERVFAELRRIVIAEGAVAGLELMDELGVTEVILPELHGLRGVAQSRYHHLDVHEHTRAVLGEVIRLHRGEGNWLGEHRAAVAELLAQPLANELTRGQALRFGALFHDVAKPATRGVTSEGRVTFIGHDAAGAEMAAAALTRLRASERLAEYVAALTRHHLRLGFLVHERPLARRAIYRYLRACEPVAADVTLLSVADRLATRGHGSEEAIARHLDLARQLLGEALRWIEQPPRPPLDGRELASALGLRPGPELGRLLAELEEASFAGEVSSPEQAIALARELAAGSVG